MMGYDPFKVWSPAARRLADKALWYAWGRIDAGTSATANASLDMGTAFSEWYGGLAELHESERANYLPSILNEWERFSTAGRIPAEVFVKFTPVMLVPSEQSWKDHTECVGFSSGEFIWHCHAHQVYSERY